MYLIIESEISFRGTQQREHAARHCGLQTGHASIVGAKFLAQVP